MADVLRGPTFFGPYTKPLVIAVGLANLLTGTLAPAAASPFVNPQTTQVQKRQIYADTCTSSKLLLFQSSIAPTSNLPHPLTQRRAIFSETSESSALLTYPSALAPVKNETPPLTQRRAILSETSKSSAVLAYPSSDRPFQRQSESVNYRQPAPLQTIPPNLLAGQLGAVAPPFTLPPFVQVHARPALLADTSQDSYPLVFPSLDRPFFRLPDPQVYRQALLSETSQSSWSVTYVTVAPPFFGATQPLVQRRSILSETSRSAFPPINPSSDAPFTRLPDPQVFRRALTSETSESSWPLIYAAQVPPFFGTTPPLTQRRLILSETSRSAAPLTYPSSDIPFFGRAYAQDPVQRLVQVLPGPNLVLSTFLPVSQPFSSPLWSNPVEYRHKYAPAQNWTPTQGFYQTVTIKLGSWIRYRTI